MFKSCKDRHVEEFQELYDVQTLLAARVCVPRLDHLHISSDNSYFG